MTGRLEGPALDAAVAEQVMGVEGGHVHNWVPYTDPDDGYGAADGWYCTICCPSGFPGALLMNDPRHDAQYYRTRPKQRPYSTTIAAAWLIVEKLEAQGCTVTYRTTGPREGLCRVEIDAPPPDLKGPSALFAANAVTAPLAICLAALEFAAATKEAS